MAAGNALGLFDAVLQRIFPAQRDSVTGGLIVRAFQSFISAATVAKTANYTIGTVATDVVGTIFTNRGAAGAVTFTLPSPTAGAYYFFAGIVAQTMTISAGSAIGVTVNNAAATSIAYSTASQQIGSFAVAIADGSSWLLINIGTNTATVA
jgi:hypothetical protein